VGRYGFPCHSRLAGTWPTVETIIRFFASSHQLHQLAPRTVVLATLFLLGIAAQAVSGILMHHRGAGWTLESVAAHYRGRTIDHAVLTPTELELAMAGDPAFTDAPPKTWSALLDVAHMHLAWMPILVFIVAHLFAMAPGGRSAWAGWIGYATFIAAFADIIAPFLVRYAGAGWAWLKLGGFIVLEAGLLLMIAITVAGGVSALLKQRREGKSAP
jgi:hypothetical protein